MKRNTYIIFSIILIIVIMIFSISNKEKIEYGLIELTGEELINTFLDENVSIVFALYNEKDIEADSFLKDLNKVSKQTKENIYYVNTHFVTTEFEQIIDAALSREANIQSYLVIQEGKIIIDNIYSGFDNLYRDLNGKRYDTKVEKVSKEKKLEYIEQAKKYYEEGNIAYAFNNLCGAWDLPEAKNEYKTNPYYTLIGSWEHVESGKKEETMSYTNFHFLKYNSTLYTATKESEIKSFKKPTLNEYKEEEIKIKDNKIYIKNKKNNKYEAKYDILLIEEYNIVIQKGEKKYNFQYGY